MKIADIVRAALDGERICILCRTRDHAEADYLRPITEIVSRVEGATSRNMVVALPSGGRIHLFVARRGAMPLRGLHFDHVVDDAGYDEASNEARDVAKLNTRPAPGKQRAGRLG